MIEKKKRICVRCKKETYIFARKHCRYCYQHAFHKQIASKASIKGLSDNMKKRKRLYSSLRLEYLEYSPTCECCKDASKVVEIHHKKGREGENLFRHFMTICRDCHNWVHNHPEESLKLGFLISKLEND